MSPKKLETLDGFATFGTTRWREDHPLGTKAECLDEWKAVVAQQNPGRDYTEYFEFIRVWLDQNWDRCQPQEEAHNE